MKGCPSCGAVWESHERVAVQAAELRALGSAIGDHSMYGETRRGPSLAATVYAMLGQHAMAQAILEAVL